MKKLFLSLFLCCSLLIPTVAYAAEPEMEKPVASDSTAQEGEIHFLREAVTRGSSKPGSNASVHNLDVSNYNYQLTDFGYRLFTDKWLTSTSGEITVKLSDFKTIEEYNGATKNKITFKLCDSSGVLVSSERTVTNGSASVTWINISSSKKYYVCFEVPTNGNRYSGNGYISN